MSVPDNWERVATRVQHPTKANVSGALVRHRVSGIHRILEAGMLRPVPQNWAIKAAAQGDGKSGYSPASPLLDSWEVVKQSVEYPTRPGVKGVLVQHRVTGLYRVLVDGTLRSVEQVWATKTAAG